MRNNGMNKNTATMGEWDQQYGDQESRWPSMSGRMLSWLTASQAIIQLSGLLVILDACFR